MLTGAPHDQGSTLCFSDESVPASHGAAEPPRPGNPRKRNQDRRKGKARRAHAACSQRGSFRNRSHHKNRRQTIPYKATAATILLKNEKEEPTALIYYTAYTRTDAKDTVPAPHFLRLQRRPRLRLRLAAHGRVRSQARGHRQRRAHSAPALQTRRQRQLFARQNRPRLHRPRRHRLQPRRRQSPEQGFLGRRFRRQIPRRIHHHLRQPQRSLELPQIPDRRKLRHLPLRRSLQLPAKSQRHVFQRHRADLFRPRPRHHFIQPRRRPALHLLPAELRRHRLVSQGSSQSPGQRPHPDRRNPPVRRHRIRRRAHERLASSAPPKKPTSPKKSRTTLA